jgi:uncharacterized protein (TIGR03083 family)
VTDPTDAAHHVDAMEREGRALARTAAGALQADIPTCPGWSMTDLLVHLGSWHRWVTGIVADAELEPRRPPAEELPDGADPVEWYVDQLDGLTGVLRRTDPTAPTWTVTIDHRAGAWAGRQAGETAVHRWDADHAVGRAEPIARAEAYLEEWLGEAVPNILPFLGIAAPAGRLGLELTDSGRRLSLAAAGDTSELRRDDDTATDVTMRGTASDVLLALGGRPSAAIVKGDESVLQAWRSVLT